MLKTQLTARRLVETAPDTVARFWANVRCPPIGNACWTWRLPSGGGRQPSLSIRGHPVQAARIAHFIVTGEWPLAFRWMRTCDNPNCVRPSHGRWHVGTTTLRSIGALDIPSAGLSTSDLVYREIEAARAAGVIDELWAAD